MKPFNYSLKKAVIITQCDYSHTRLVDHSGARKCDNFDESSNDIKLAAWVARSFGVDAQDIDYIEDWNLSNIKAVFEGLKKQFKSYSKIDQRCFLFVYCQGHGCFDLEKWYMILNGLYNNIFPIEETLRDITKYAKLSTVFAVYNLSRMIGPV